ncbi:protein spire isoform X2 [Condylostylus longicornis]|uniref:protein spire isoform X2 n=1 Tax=Condylostylus longicornis TaxID=2530218 RepID=UPI00244DF158|nr:protein spire isoform X2 [Condylostylus longicornis]
MNKSKSTTAISDGGGGFNVTPSNTNSSPNQSKEIDSIQSSKDQPIINNNINKKRKSLILCDIKNESNDDNHFDNDDIDDDDDDDDDDIIFVDSSDDPDNEILCNSLTTVVGSEKCCDSIKILNSTTTCYDSNNYNNSINNKNNKSNNSNNIILNNSNNRFQINNRHVKLNQHQVEYDSQGEEEGFIDSSMESAIEIKECCTNNIQKNTKNSKKSSEFKIIKNNKNFNKLNKTIINNDGDGGNSSSSNSNSNSNNINHDNENDLIDIDHIDDGDDGDDDDDDDNNDSNHIINNDHNIKKIIQNMKKFNNIKMNNSNNDNSNNTNTITNINNVSDNIKSANDLICYCCNRDGCISLKDILSAFNAPISEEQAWALIFQLVKLYRDSIINAYTNGLRCCKVSVPNNLDNLSIHLDGSVHINYKKVNNGDSSAVTSHKRILHKIGHVIFLALDYNLQADEDCIMSSQLEHLISQMTAIEEIDDEGIERDSEDCEDLDFIIEACIPRVQPSVPEDHYKAVCRAFATEAQDLRTFLQKVFHGDTQALRIKADAVDSNQELDKLGFNDWARFWMQVVDELRQGVRLKRRDFRDVTRTPVEYELTPYEILMEDIRAKKYNLRKVMVNGDIPPRVKKDAHAVILEFIRSRPPLKKASERKLPPPVKRNPSPREQLMDSIRKGRPLKPVPQPTLKNRLLPSTSQQHESLKYNDDKFSISSSSTSSTTITNNNNMTCSSSISNSTAGSSRSITKNSQKSNNKTDLSHMMHDPYSNIDEIDYCSRSMAQQQQHQQQQQSIQQLNNFSQPKMPAYPIAGYTTSKETTNSSNSSNKSVIRRTKDTVTQDEYHRFFDNALESYDLATQCESRRASMRRHTIVGCQSVCHNETQSVPPSRPDSRQSSCHQPNNKYPNHMSSSTIGVTGTSGTFDRSTGPLKYHTKSNQSGEPTPTISTTNLSNTESFTKNNDHDETNSHWMDKTTSDRLSLTLEEIVHIRSVMTKAELEGLPVGVRVKEEVEKRKICFLCLRTRFTIFVWGIQCKLCQRTVCSKCSSKMRIPTEHFRNVPVVLLSPSLIGSPASSSAASPCHHSSISHPNSSIDETFPKTLMERLMRSESDRKARNSVGSAPSSPKNQRSNMSTPGVAAGHHSNDLMTKSSDSHTLLSNGYNKENNSTTLINGGIAANRQVAGIMSRSMEGPRSLPMQSPGRAHSNCSTLDRKNRFARALTLSSSASHGAVDLKENLRGEMMSVCNDCRDLVLEIIRSTRQTRSSARNQALKNLTLDISPVYK